MNEQELDGILEDAIYDNIPELNAIYGQMAIDEAKQAIQAYITANYTPNTKLKALIEESQRLNLEFHGRPDCKNCSLQEQLAELTKSKEVK